MTDAAAKPSLLVVSGVMPYPGDAGQQQRVRQKLVAFGERFEVTFLSAVPEDDLSAARERLAELCDAAILLPSRWRRGAGRFLADPLAARLYAVTTGLKVSNYALDRVELSPRRVLAALGSRRFDGAVFEYWHTARTARALRNRGIPCVLDMHDLLWQSRRRQLAAHAWLPEPLREGEVARYRRQEEAAWQSFEALITINAAEDAYVARRLPQKPRFHAPMGVDMNAWSFDPEPAEPPRLAYYGGLGSSHNRRDARRCVEAILPRIWRVRPDAELWIVGGRPPMDLQELAAHDPRLVVTGFVEDVQSVLRTMTAVLCPWTGTYGFRSRLVEVMALGVPVVASPDAVDGMGLEHGEGLFLGEDDAELARLALELLTRPESRQEQARHARRAVEARYSFDATYGRLTRELAAWLEER